MQTIAQQLNIKEFPFEIRDKDGKILYYEDSDGDWYKREFDSKGNEKYYENARGRIIDNRPKCDDKTIEEQPRKWFEATHGEKAVLYYPMDPTESGYEVGFKYANPKYVYWLESKLTKI